MSKLQKFTNRLERINGVESFVLVRHGGEVVAHNFNSPDDLASMITICGIESRAIMQTIGFAQFRFLMFNRIDQRNFLVFFLDRYFLGIQQIAGTDNQRLSEEIYEFLQNVRNQNRKEVQN